MVLSKPLIDIGAFVFITGISRFSRVGVFSTMNNLDDLTMSVRSANMLGITEDELRFYFKEYIEEFAEHQQISSEDLVAKIRTWYDGFRFAHEGENVYNPMSTIQLFLDRRFSNYWFATGTPKFLVDLMTRRSYDVQSLERVEAGRSASADVRVGQSGYYSAALSNRIPNS